MGEALIIFLILLAACACAVVMAFVWIVSHVVQFVTGGRKRDRHTRGPGTSNVAFCGNDQCHADNPPNARFCRRCGRTLPGVFNLPIRQIASL